MLLRRLGTLLTRGGCAALRKRMMSSGVIQYDAEKIASGLVAGNRFMLSKAITLVESTREDHRMAGSQILELSLQKATQMSREKRVHNARGSFRMGISGPPGVGKSTFIESVGMKLLNQGYKIAVIAVDPSSHISGGSILGDKTRMTELGLDPNAYIRPCATSGQLGGIAQHTDEIVLLCESAGYDMVLIETVGVGQSEVLVSEISDMFLLLLPPAGGDSLQGMKRGIVEAADLIVINKADGDLLIPAKRAQAEYRNGLAYINSQNSWWRPDVLTCSALKKDGVDEVWEKADSFWGLGTNNGSIERRRGKQRAKWMWKKAEGDICRLMRDHPKLQEMALENELSLGRGEHSPRWAAERMVRTFLDTSHHADYEVEV